MEGEYYSIAELSNFEHNRSQERRDSDAVENAREIFHQRKRGDSQQFTEGGGEFGSDLSSRTLFPSTPSDNVAGNLRSNNNRTAFK